MYYGRLMLDRFPIGNKETNAEGSICWETGSADSRGARFRGIGFRGALVAARDPASRKKPCAMSGSLALLLSEHVVELDINANANMMVAAAS